jgi:hypothetical protein
MKRPSQALQCFGELGKLGEGLPEAKVSFVAKPSLRA